MPKIPRSTSELEAMLGEQLAFLAASSDSYDRGFFGEAKRLATTIRVLVHDTKNSHSLLGQLGRKSGDFLDTSVPIHPDNRSSHGGLVMMGVGGKDGGRHLPMGDDVPYQTWLPFDKWWRNIVFVDDRGQTMSRADLVLTAANQDGGAHVDPALDETYLRLTRDNSMGWVAVSGSQEAPVGEAGSASIRQIAHELRRSLDSTYAWKPKYDVGVFAGGAVVVEGSDRIGAPFASVGRNEKCPCGSGKKFKKCHGASRAV
jgi:hypothetical protein